MICEIERGLKVLRGAHNKKNKGTENKNFNLSRIMYCGIVSDRLKSLSQACFAKSCNLMLSASFSLVVMYVLKT